jgi:hypothetical protein
VHIYRSQDGGASWEDLTGDWNVPQAERTSIWCTWTFSADLIPDPASGFGLYALRETQIESSAPLPVYNLYKWVPDAR